MEHEDTSSQLLKQKYNLHRSAEVDAAATRTRIRTGENVSKDPFARIQNYLNRFHEITDRGDPIKREHGIDASKRLLYRKYVIRPEEIPESYFENQRRLAREQGHGDIDVTPEMRDQLTEVIIADQRSSLDKWIDYFASPDSPYSDSLKYFTLRSVLNMAEYDKEKKIYPQRSKGTTKPFPDLNREALAYVLDAIEKKYKGQNIDLLTLDSQGAKEFEKLLAGENFAKLYAWAIEKVTPASPEELSATKGEWIKYNQGSDHMHLVQSLQGHGTGWCTVGESIASRQIKDGDFYVYYSLDRSGKPTVPRAAIRMSGNRIAEVRGIAKEQNLDPFVVPTVEEKLKEFPDGPAYQRRVTNMRRLTAIENQIKAEQNPSAQDLAFLYEIDLPIEGFGYQKDPRIAKLCSQRNLEEDMPIVFGCSMDQIARTTKDIRPDTKAYVGHLEPGIFDKLQGVEYIYTSFPERKIERQIIEIGGRTAQQLETELKKAGVKTSPEATIMLQSNDFTTLSRPQPLEILHLKLQDLGFTWEETPRTGEIYRRAKEIGLGLCPAEVGPHLRLIDTNQPMREYYYIGMEPISYPYSGLDVFALARHEGNLLLRSRAGGHNDWWGLSDEFIFLLPQADLRT